MTMIVPCILCREPLPSVPLEHEKHLQSEHKVNFHKSLIIRKTLKERRRPTMYEKEAINDESDVINVTCLLCRESLPSLLHENEKHFQNVHKINFHLSWIIGKNLKEGRKSVSILNEDLKKPNTILCDDFEQPVQIGEISKCLTENQNRKMKKFVPDDSIENERKQFSCDICGKLFETERSVRTHKRNHISANKTFFEDDLNILYDEETLQTKNFVTQNLHVRSQPRGPYESDVKHITNNVSKEVKTKKEINWDISTEGDIKNEELKEYSIKVSGGTRYVGPYGEVFIPEDCEEDSGNKENNNSEEKETYNVRAGMNVEEDERESLWKSFMSDLADEDDNTEENVSEKDETEERNSQETHRKENKKNELYENMDVEEDENKIKMNDQLEVNIQTGKVDGSAKISTGRKKKIYISKMPSEDRKAIENSELQGINMNNNKMMDDISIKMETNMENKNSTYSDSNQSLVSAIDKIFLCEKCEKPFGSKMGLYHHTKSIHEGVSYSCDQCDWKGRQSYHLKHHIKSFHEGVRYSCDHCNYESTDQTNLRRHTLKCKIPKPYKCSVCKKGFKSKYYVEVHNKAEHEGIRYNCSQCDHKAIHRTALKFHFQSVHEGIRYSCEQCFHKFTSKYSLLAHVKKCKSNI